MAVVARCQYPVAFRVKIGCWKIANRPKHKKLLPETASQMRAVPSLAAVMTRLPSGLKFALSTTPSWPFRTAVSVPFETSQMRAVLS